MSDPKKEQEGNKNKKVKGRSKKEEPSLQSSKRELTKKQKKEVKRNIKKALSSDHLVSINLFLLPS